MLNILMYYTPPPPPQKKTKKNCYWVILHVFLSSADFFSKLTFSKTSLGDTVKMSNSLLPDHADVLSSLIWVQTVCKDYQQTLVVGKEITCSIPLVSMYFQLEWKTVWILIRWLHQKPADPDLHHFQKRIIAGLLIKFCIHIASKMASIQQCIPNCRSILHNRCFRTSLSPKFLLGVVSSLK